MKLYNSYSQTIEELKPIEPGKISMYVCGPTVYNYPHIGNARPIVVFDTLKKEHSFLFRCIGDMLLRIPHPFTPRERIESSHSRSHRLGRTVLALLAGVASIATVPRAIETIKDRVDPTFTCEEKVVQPGDTYWSMVEEAGDGNHDPRPAVDESVKKNGGQEHINPGEELEICHQ